VRKKDLDQLEMIVRKGNLMINCRHLFIDFGLMFEYKNDEQPVRLTHLAEPKKQHEDAKSFNTRKQALAHLKAGKPIKLARTSNSWNSAESTHLDIKRLNDCYGRSRKIEILTTDIVKAATEQDDNSYTIKVRGDLIKGIITPEEIKAIREDSKPYLEWFRFFRVIRKRIRKAMLDGRLNGLLGKFDWIKELKDHDTKMKLLCDKLAELRTAILSYQSVAGDLQEQYKVFIGVQPYEGLYHSLGRIDSNVNNIIEDINDIEVDAGIRKEEETDEE